MVMGRPRIEIDFDLLDSLCGIQCTQKEIISILECNEDTVNTRIKEKTGLTFSEYYKEKSAKGKSSIRRMQYKKAMEGNVVMLIWLGKNWLGQSDKQETTTVNSDQKLIVQFGEDKDG